MYASSMGIVKPKTIYDAISYSELNKMAFFEKLIVLPFTNITYNLGVRVSSSDTLNKAILQKATCCSWHLQSSSRVLSLLKHFVYTQATARRTIHSTEWLIGDATRKYSVLVQAVSNDKEDGKKGELHITIIRNYIRFSGTIIGIGDVDPLLHWDEISVVSRPERISPGEIEPFVALVSLNPLPAARIKGPRVNTLPVSPDFLILGSSQASSDSMQVPKFTRVLQGQEARSTPNLCGIGDYFCNSYRTPICNAKCGGFKDTFPEDLLSPVLKVVIDKTGVSPNEVGDIVVGIVLTPGSQRASECTMAAFHAFRDYTG
ncbi:hypothetical protein SUGI_0751610 [Cryptomeria japonica]|nr:hypothetical protein SUGI_0751610 [Cryptomeria japonica]